MNDVVIGIDASTTAVKAIAFTRDGTRALPGAASLSALQPASRPFRAGCRGLVDRADRRAEAGRRLRRRRARSRRFRIAHQRETFTLIDRAGKPLIPAILWLDERARPQVARLSAELGRDNIRDWSGKPPDPTPALYAVAWLAEHRPEVLRDAAAIVDVGGFLSHRLTGRLVTSTASADPLGLLDVATGAWHPALVEAAGLAAGATARACSRRARSAAA